MTDQSRVTTHWGIRDRQHFPMHRMRAIQVMPQPIRCSGDRVRAMATDNQRQTDNGFNRKSCETTEWLSQASKTGGNSCAREPAGWPDQNGWVPQAQDAAPSAHEKHRPSNLASSTHGETSCHFATCPFWTGHPANRYDRLVQKWCGVTFQKLHSPVGESGSQARRGQAA